MYFQRKTSHFNFVFINRALTDLHAPEARYTSCWVRTTTENIVELKQIVSTIHNIDTFNTLSRGMLQPLPVTFCWKTQRLQATIICRQQQFRKRLKLILEGRRSKKTGKRMSLFFWFRNKPTPVFKMREVRRDAHVIAAITQPTVCIRQVYSKAVSGESLPWLSANVRT